ncbi:MAG TPA: cupin domain-containing protein [Steroidobacter sp.]|jgi:quercetin dioxygenase-like cupin family protein|nr:cupin domain-containing protein [Steroidobacteraceae bacterium]HLS80279.1 cupin domain-containing protein [Steroidobacter sp.]
MKWSTVAALVWAAIPCATLACGAPDVQADAPVKVAQAATGDEKPQVKRTVLRRVNVPDSKYEVLVVLVEAPAGASAGRHTHPGSVIGYVIEGEYTMMIDGEPVRALKPGDSLEVPSGAVHDERAGDEPAKLLAVFTVERGEPLSAPAP